MKFMISAGDGYIWNDKKGESEPEFIGRVMGATVYDSHGNELIEVHAVHESRDFSFCVDRCDSFRFEPGSRKALVSLTI